MRPEVGGGGALVGRVVEKWVRKTTLKRGNAKVMEGGFYPQQQEHSDRGLHASGRWWNCRMLQKAKVQAACVCISVM